jgi:rubrerythrin
MANKQVRDVIRAVRRFHGKLADLYQNMSDHACKERLKILLYYMVRHQHYLDDSLQRYEKEGSRKALDSWFRMKTDEDIIAALEQIRFSPEGSCEEIVDQALKVDARLISFYKHLAEVGENQEVRDLFHSLYEMEKKYENALVRDAVEMEDE